MQRISFNNELVVGSLYWLKDKVTNTILCLPCLETSGRKYFGLNVWAEDDNNQALERWVILGPIPVPDECYFTGDHSKFDEARITINGNLISQGASMTVRVAITSFLVHLKENGLGDDEMGKRICEGYKYQCDELISLIIP